MTPFRDFNSQPNRLNRLIRSLLKPLSLIYRGLITIWLFLYKSGLKKSYSPQKPTLSVGNITVGGTGKTPMVDWLLSYYQHKKLSVSVLTRGYGAKSGRNPFVLNRDSPDQQACRRSGDEPWMLFKRHPEATFYIHPNRVASARQAETNSDVLILDDGMQHLKIRSNLNIVLIDSLSGIGNGKLLPAGPLREPLHGLNRADIVVYTRSNLASPQQLKNGIEPYLRPHTPQFQASFVPDSLLPSVNKPPLAVSVISQKKCLLFSGIGNPASFTLTIEHAGGNVLDHLVFKDHEDYPPSSLERLRRFLNRTDYDYAICTEKDWVKLEEHKEQLPEFWYLVLTMSIEEGFAESIDELMNSRRTG